MVLLSLLTISLDKSLEERKRKKKQFRDQLQASSEFGLASLACGLASSACVKPVPHGEKDRSVGPFKGGRITPI